MSVVMPRSTTTYKHLVEETPTNDRSEPVPLIIDNNMRAYSSFFLTLAAALSSHSFFAHGFSSLATTISSNVIGSRSLSLSNKMDNGNHDDERIHHATRRIQSFPRGGAAAFGGGHSKHKTPAAAAATTTTTTTTELKQSRTPYNTESKCPVTGAVAFL